MRTIEEMNIIIAKFMGFEDESRIVGGRKLMRKKTEFKFGAQQYKEIPYDKLSYHSDWNLLIEAYTVHITDLWNKGENSDYLFTDFSDCISRNAPVTALEILCNSIQNSQS